MWSNVTMVTMSILRTVNTKPKFLAADTNAASSGDWALYLSLPEGDRGYRGVSDWLDSITILY